MLKSKAMKQLLLAICLISSFNLAYAEDLEDLSAKDVKKIIKEKSQNIKRDAKEIKKAIAAGVEKDSKEIEKQYKNFSKELKRRQDDLQEIIESLK